MTRALSYSGLGAGPHILTAGLHRGFFFSFDTVRTPGLAPFRESARSGVYRIEEDDPYLKEIQRTWGNGIVKLVETMPSLPFPEIPHAGAFEVS